MRGVVETDGAEVFELLQARGLFAHDQRDTWFRYAAWAYWRNPYRGDRPPGWVIEEQGRIVAYVGCVFMPYRLGTWKGTGGSVENLTVDASVRGPLAVVFTRKHLRADGAPVQFAGHFSASGTLLWKPFRAAECGGTDATYVGVLSHRKFAAAKARQAGWAGRVAAAAQLPLLAVPFVSRRTGPAIRARSTGRAVSVPRLSELPADEVDALCAGASAGLDALVARDAAFLAWRYEARPDAPSFRYVAVRDSGRLVGLAVVQDRGALDQRLYEFLVAPEAESVAQELLGGVVHLARENGGALLLTKMVRPELADFWVANGFRRESKTANQYLIASALPEPMPSAPRTMYTYAEAKLW